MQTISRAIFCFETKRNKLGVRTFPGTSRVSDFRPAADERGVDDDGQDVQCVLHKCTLCSNPSPRMDGNNLLQTGYIQAPVSIMTGSRLPYLVFEV